MKKRISYRRIFRRIFGRHRRPLQTGAGGNPPPGSVDTSTLGCYPFIETRASSVSPEQLLSAKTHAAGSHTICAAPELLVKSGKLPGRLGEFLTRRGNHDTLLRRLATVLEMKDIIVEIGCGDAEVAWKIALKNPSTGVIATDKYEMPCIAGRYSRYGWIAKSWKNGLLPAQIFGPLNLVVLRAEGEILELMPSTSIDSILIVNPEPAVGKAFLTLLSEKSLMSRIKPGLRKIVVKPFSSDVGMSVFSNFEFENIADRSRGLGFLYESDFVFTKGDRIHWGVDLNAASGYSANSTQTDVYIHGDGMPVIEKGKIAALMLERFFDIRNKREPKAHSSRFPDIAHRHGEPLTQYPTAPSFQGSSNASGL